MDRDLVNPELRKSYRFVPAVPVGNRMVLRALRVMMPLAPKAKVPDDVRLEVVAFGHTGARGVHPDRQRCPVRPCCGSMVGEW